MKKKKKFLSSSIGTGMLRWLTMVDTFKIDGELFAIHRTMTAKNQSNKYYSVSHIPTGTGTGTDIIATTKEKAVELFKDKLRKFLKDETWGKRTLKGLLKSWYILNPPKSPCFPCKHIRVNGMLKKYKCPYSKTINVTERQRVCSKLDRNI